MGDKYKEFKIFVKKTNSWNKARLLHRELRVLLSDMCEGSLKSPVDHVTLKKQEKYVHYFFR